MATLENRETQDLLTRSSLDPESGDNTTSPVTIAELVQSLNLQVMCVLHRIVSLGVFLATDFLLKKAFAASSDEFLSAISGMFGIFTALVILDYVSPDAAEALVNFFDPGLMFIQRWLPLFYVPYLVVLPLTVKDMLSASTDKTNFLIVGGGWVSTLGVFAFTPKIVRETFSPALQEEAEESMEIKPSFSLVEVLLWTEIFLMVLVATMLYPIALWTYDRTSIPLMLSATVLGYIIGSRLPSQVKQVFNPIIFCAAFVILTAYVYAFVTNSGLDTVLGFYLSKSSSNPGAGNILIGFMGSVILSFAFFLFKQRELIRRHAPEFFISFAISATFFMYASSLFAILDIIIEPSLAASILPKTVTVAMALSLLPFFEGANFSLTVAVVVLIGFIGANLKPPTTYETTNGFGAAPLSANEPDALSML